jgi:hypothetical protein
MNCAFAHEFSLTLNELKHSVFRELHALRALWKYYNNAKLCFAIHAPLGAIHEIENFNSCKLRLQFIIIKYLPAENKLSAGNFLERVLILVRLIRRILPRTFRSI